MPSHAWCSFEVPCVKRTCHRDANDVVAENEDDGKELCEVETRLSVPSEAKAISRMYAKEPFQRFQLTTHAVELASQHNEF